MSVAVKRVVEESLLDLLLCVDHMAPIHQSLDVCTGDKKKGRGIYRVIVVHTTELVSVVKYLN